MESKQRTEEQDSKEAALRAEETLTYKEIGEQAEAVETAFRSALQSGGWVEKYVRKGGEQAIFIGSGSSYYQAQTMAAVYRAWLGRPAISLPSSDLLLVRKQSAVEERTAVVFGVSRSGESTEVLLALKAAQTVTGWKTAGVTCYADSEMAKLAPCLVSEKGKERSTVMTKSLSSMVTAAQTAIASASGQAKYIQELERTVGEVGAVVDKAKALASGIVRSASFNKTIFLGMGALFGIAQEGCLKLKEMSNVWTESFGTLEFRHGPKAIADEGTCIVVLLSEQAREQELKVAAEMKDYGAYIVLIAASAGPDTAFADQVLEVGLPDVSDEARSILYLPLLQYYGTFTAVKLGLNPDHPKNLTQVVVL
ncbi:glucosamine--fructose-6-phosphate aminotransferase (isomerizing) [Paenibacillus sp. UNC496MF]|uniref:SIS domain-containing protein n=1 Tax=Paenibacillus sp. UNC496MF TaxID=1502753 RepID=UPI0008ED9888|nr:SIS domain-containing protein [Paenibacillus sp. UNC496MF]SFI80050.1 glucosamine--fructose-6-phosphate aminotransferase (isomerizing) [Paenibacillus sp. UNC496MF]